MRSLGDKGKEKAVYYSFTDNVKDSFNVVRKCSCELGAS